MSAFFNNLAGNANLLDPQELEANRRGEITETQKRRLNATHGWGQIVKKLVEILIMGLFLLPAFLIFIPLIIEPAIRPQIVVGLLLILILVLATFDGRNIWKLWNQYAKLWRDQSSRAIRQAQGHLSYGKKGYRFRSGERTLVLPSGGTGGLLPATTYRVYYLEESGILLSSEEAFSANPAQARAALDKILARANGFSFEDLVANRTGEATPAQRRQVIHKVIAGASLMLVALAFLASGIFVVFSTKGDTSMFMLLYGAFIVIFVLVGIFLLVKPLLDLFISAPEQVQGTGHKKMRISSGRYGTKHYYYVVGGQRFEIKHAAYMALIDGLEYRVYYLPRTKRLIAIEALDSSPGNSPF